MVLIDYWRDISCPRKENMAAITLKSRDGESSYFGSGSTILHVKRYLKCRIEEEYPRIDEEWISIVFNGKALSDAILLG